MKKLITLIMVSVITITKFINMQNLNNKKINNNFIPSLQLQIIINNETSDVIGAPINIFNANTIIWFYLDITLDDKTYYQSNFNNGSFNTKAYTNDGKEINAPYQDTFWTDMNKLSDLITLNLDPNRTGIIINFTFGVFDGFHYQLISVNNFLYNYNGIYINTHYNGTKLIINANGGWGSNTANWGLQFYKF